LGGLSAAFAPRALRPGGFVLAESLLLSVAD
jgi:hypothetical protein